MKQTKAIAPADIQVGANIRRRRVAMNISQEKLADSLGITFQQVQKYEKGANRVSASRLVQIAALLQVDIRDLFAGVEGIDTTTSEPFPFMSKEAILLARDFQSIASPEVRQNVRSLVKSLGTRLQDADAA